MYIPECGYVQKTSIYAHACVSWRVRGGVGGCLGCMHVCVRMRWPCLFACLALNIRSTPDTSCSTGPHRPPPKCTCIPSTHPWLKLSSAIHHHTKAPLCCRQQAPEAPRRRLYPLRWRDRPLDSLSAHRDLLPLLLPRHSPGGRGQWQDRQGHCAEAHPGGRACARACARHRCCGEISSTND